MLKCTDAKNVDKIFINLNNIYNVKIYLITLKLYNI